MVTSKYNIIFSNEEKKYVYNLSSKALIEIDNDMELLLKQKEFTIDKEIEKILFDNGIVTISNEFETERMINNMNNIRYDSSKMGIFLSLTPDCNLNCTYCYQDVRKGLHNTAYLNEENWRKIYEYLQNKIIKNKVASLTVFLFGGEPMLIENKLKKYIQELRKLPTKIMLVLITNGTMFTKDNVGFFCENIDSIQITMDGVKAVHDKLKPYKNGEGSFDDIYTNLLLLMENNVREVTLRINLNLNTVKSAYDFVDWLCKEGINKKVKAVKFAAIFVTQSEMVNYKNNEELLNEIGDLYLYSAKKGLRTYKDYDGGLCIGKMQNGFAIDENLNIYCCPGVLYQKPIGRLEEGDISIHSTEWFKFINNDSQCIKTCKYAPICFGGCNCLKECKKNSFDMILSKVLQAYVLSSY